MKVKEEYTPARRWSFLVGKNETSHTAQSRLVNMLANDEYSPTFVELEEAFDIETVTKEFFIKYRELFIRTKEELDKIVETGLKPVSTSLKNEFDAKGVNTVDFAKKLLGQIIFLYFLQKKGWFGVGRDDDWGTGSKHFLRELFEKKVTQASSLKEKEHKQDACDTTSSLSKESKDNHKQDVCDTINFFNDILEPLFYEALRNDRSHDDHYYSRFNCKIPFLNGGLFDPINNYDWVHTDICLPDSLFSNKNKTKEGDEGDGILDIFDRYNFTVREDEPLEKEVAIDPELLGKAYEKFNAIRPDNYEEYKRALKSGKKGEESKFNKQYGVYYTPREIVHYMCQQSLINYLYTEVTQASSLREEHKQDACVTSSLSLLENIYYDSSEPVAKRRRNLPHWEQGKKAYFVTFRLCDSIPKEAAENIRQERQQWFEKNKITAASEVEKLSRENQIEYYRLFSRRYDELLDNGHGSCALANSDCKKIVEEALNHFNNERYHLDKYVVMPNHVHVIVIPMESWPLEKILHSWKSYTAKEINKLLYREGELWMHESFDHIIRSPEQLERIRNYIVTQASSLSSQQRKQDACVTITKEDIETLIHIGEQVSENEATALLKERLISEGKQKTTKNKPVLPESIKNNAALIDQKLANITVCDPAVGSGAFPVGMMSEIVKARNVLSVFVTQAPVVTQASSLSSQQHKQDACDTYNFKRHCIEHSLYGVDIDPGAVEIAKLRLWLSLVVDEDDIKNIKPLPNLDYKIVCGNSLLGVEKNLFNLNSFNELEKLKPLFFNETSPTKKQEYRVKIDNLISKITNGHREFDFEIYFSEVFHHKGGFDVVIANPPYVQLQKDGGRLANMFKNCGYKTFERTGDIYSLFYEKGINLLKNDAVLTFITSNKWMRAGYGKSLRKFFNSYNPRLLIDLGPGIFEFATVDTNILIIEKKRNQGQLAGLTLNAGAKDADLSDFIINNKNILPKMGDDAWFIGNQAEQDLKEKIERIGKQLKEWDVNIYRGVLTGLNEAFIIDTATRDRLVAEDPKSAEILKPILRGRDIKRYGYELVLFSVLVLIQILCIVRTVLVL